MYSPHELQLRQKADSFVRYLHSKKVKAAIVDDSVREYSIKVLISESGQAKGFAIIYYSPKRDSFTCKTHEIREQSTANNVLKLWHDLHGVSMSQVQEGWQAYVDGAYMNGNVGFGAVVIYDGHEKARFSGRVSDETHSRQVAGELQAVLHVLHWCEDNGINEVAIVYDYEGIEKWAKGRWKATLPLTQNYARIVKASPVKIHWRKVKSHSGDHWNDVADALAKKGATTIS